MFWKTYVAVLISRSSFQKSSDIFVVNVNGVSINVSGVSLIISIDSTLILLFPVELPSTEKINDSSAKFRTSVDRCWDVNVDRWSSRMSRPLFEAFIYATSCVINSFVTFCWCSGKLYCCTKRLSAPLAVWRMYAISFWDTCRIRPSLALA